MESNQSIGIKMFLAAFGETIYILALNLN